MPKDCSGLLQGEDWLDGRPVDKVDEEDDNKHINILRQVIKLSHAV